MTDFNASEQLKNVVPIFVHLLVSEPHISIVFVIVVIIHSKIRPKWVSDSFFILLFSIVLRNCTEFPSLVSFVFAEKHKTYHIKDELLARDGFKKFMKNEPCSFDRCRFSLQCNHIHCVRENCFYVLHSSGQLLSHKRKHDRQDSEHAYQQYKNAHKGENSFNAEHNELEKLAGGGGTKDLSHIASILSNFGSENNDSFDMFQQLQKQALLQSQAKAAAAALVNKNNVRDDDHNSLDNNNYDPIDAAIPKSFIQNANATLGRSITPAELEQLKQIYSAAESAKQKQINALLFAQNNFNGTDQAEPLNLNVKKESKDLNDTLLSAVVQKIQNQNIPSSLQQVTSIDGLFNRKRGRPPKNRVVEVYGNVSRQLPHLPQ